MKKFYTLFAAAAVALSASALTVNGSNFKLTQSLSPKKELARNAVSLQNATPVDKAFSTPTLRKADADQSIEGNWVFTLGDFYFENSVGQQEATLTATLNGTQVVFQDATNVILPFAAAFDEATGTLTFSNDLVYTVTLQSGDQCYCRQEPYVYNYETKDLDKQDITGNFDAAAGTITFAADNGIAWAAYTDEALTTSAGYFDIEDLMAASKDNSEPEPERAWTLIGEGSFLDNIVTPGFTGADSTEPSTVDVYYDANEPTSYLIANAWKGFFVAQGWEAEDSPDMVFEAANPDNILVPLQSCGVNGGSEEGLYGIMSISYYTELTEKTIEGAEPITLTKDGDNVTVTFPITSMLMYASTSGNMYYAGGTAPSVLTFTQKDNGGIDSVVAGSNANAPVEYFNLQGVRVNNPAAGQLVIKRQGSTVSKVVVR